MILVTGGTGFLGSQLLLHLVKNKKKPIAIYRYENNVKKVKKYFCSIESEGNTFFKKIIWKKCDITIISELDEIFIGISKIYHCAALVSFSKNYINKLNLINIQGTSNIVNLSIKHKINKIGFVSSIAALGDEMYNDLINEDSLWDSSINHSPYAYSKYMAELEIWRGIEEGVPSIIINPGIILGEGIRQNPYKIICNYLNNKLVFYPEGLASIISSKDVINVFYKLMESNISNKKYILVSENLTYKKLLKAIAFKNDKRPIFIRLPKFFMFIILFFEYFISKLFFKKKLLSFSLINSLYKSKKIDGSKIEKEMGYRYSKF